MMRIKTMLTLFLAGVALVLGGCANDANVENISSENIAIFEISGERCVLEGTDKLVIKGVLTNKCDAPVSKVVIRYNIYGVDGSRTID